jgi:lipopolysaccharide/colanic/teichoic acid biosynthesis glycosyltransferase
VGLIWVFFLAVLGIFGAAISRQLTDEFKAWTPWLVNYFIRCAVRQLPEDMRTRYEEEWRSHTDEIPGEVAKLIHALNCLSASRKMSPSYLVARTLLVVRTLDVVGSMTAILFLWPLFLVAAIAIKLDSGGPIIFRQRRNGFNAKEFVIFKFRTMTVLEDGPAITQACRGDLRATRVGKFLRRSSIDELPQLLNVLKGEMSLVGPRPHAIAHDKEYKVQIADNGFRHHIKPGIFTSWAHLWSLVLRTFCFWLRGPGR